MAGPLTLDESRVMRGDISHPLILLHDPFTNKGVYIDFQMTDPILRMWRVGIQTTWCCQGDTDPLGRDGYVSFPDRTRAAEIHEIVLRALNPREMWEDPKEWGVPVWRWQRWQR